MSTWPVDMERRSPPSATDAWGGFGARRWTRGHSAGPAGSCSGGVVRGRPGDEPHTVRVPDDPHHCRDTRGHGIGRALAPTHCRSHAGVRTGTGFDVRLPRIARRIVGCVV